MQNGCFLTRSQIIFMAVSFLYYVFITSLVYITNIKNPFKQRFVKESKPNINFRTTNKKVQPKKVWRNMFPGIHLLVKDRNSERQASLDTRRPMRRLQDRQLHRTLTPASETDQSEKVILVQGLEESLERATPTLRFRFRIPPVTNISLMRVRRFKTHNLPT